MPWEEFSTIYLVSNIHPILVSKITCNVEVLVGTIPRKRTAIITIHKVMVVVENSCH